MWPQTRRCSLFLRSSLLSGNGGVALNEWKDVPDICKSFAEKYGDKIALVDPYHDPPSTMTYKHVSFFLYLFFVMTCENTNESPS